MKKLIIICTAILLSVSTFAQAPEKMSYQAVVRDGSNNLVSSAPVGMQISILQSSVSGPAIYVETQTPTSNANGLVSLEIGNGTVVSGVFSSIDWSAGPYFIKTETDPTGGTNYTISGVSQLLSVPYALHAKTAENITGTINYSESDPVFTAWDKSSGIIITESQISDLTHTIDTDTHIDSLGIASYGFITYNSIPNSNSNKFYLGQDTLGGIVFYIYKDSNGEQHGLIVNKSQSTGLALKTTNGAPTAIRLDDGAFNTAQYSTSTSPAKAYVVGLGPGWYIPSINELFLLHHSSFIVNKVLRTNGYDELFNPLWSSTQSNYTDAYQFELTTGRAWSYSTNTSYRVRAIKAF